MDNRYIHRNRRKYSLKVHIVLVTKYRKQLFNGLIAKEVKSKIHDISKVKGYHIIAMETDKDHIHLLLGYDTTEKVCDIVFMVKVLLVAVQVLLETKYYLVGRIICLQYR